MSFPVSSINGGGIGIHRRFSIGDKVRLYRNYANRELFDDSAEGPLKFGNDVGEIVDMNSFDNPYLVQSYGGEKWWYTEAALEIASDEIALVVPAINSINSSANVAVAGVASVFSSLSVRSSPSPSSQLSQTSPSSPIQTMAFLTHDWGDNEDKSSNHEIVIRVNKYLKANNIITWFDDDRMTGYVKHKMAEGIDNTKCVVAFVTERYLKKVNSNDINDNCCFEFGHAVSQRENCIIPVLEEST